MLPHIDAVHPAPRRRLSTWQAWGLVLLAPYVVVFAVFVVYPVGYGLWLARHPASYVALADDPVFAGSVVNTLLFLAVAINLKMIVALLLSGFFVNTRTWIKWLSVLFILPWAVPSIPTILSIRFMSLGEGMMRPTTMLFRNQCAMDVEESIRANPFDGVVLLMGCDKTTPALLMGAASCDLPTIGVSGGPMLNGRFRGQAIGSGTHVWKFTEMMKRGEMSEADMAGLAVRPEVASDPPQIVPTTSSE